MNKVNIFIFLLASLVASISSYANERLLTEKLNNNIGSELHYENLNSNKIFGYADINKNQMPSEYSLYKIAYIKNKLNNQIIRNNNILLELNNLDEFELMIPNFSHDNVLGKYKNLNFIANLQEGCELVVNLSTIDKYNDNKNINWIYKSSNNSYNFVNLYNLKNTVFISNKYIYEIKRLLGYDNISSEKINNDGHLVFNGTFKKSISTGLIRFKFNDVSSIKRINLKGNFGDKKVLEFTENDFKYVDANTIELIYPVDKLYLQNVSQYFIYTKPRSLRNNLLSIDIQDYDLNSKESNQLLTSAYNSQFKYYSVDIAKITNRTALQLNNISFKVLDKNVSACNIKIKDINLSNYKYIDRNILELNGENNYKKFEKINRIIYDDTDYYWDANISNYITNDEASISTNINWKIYNHIPDNSYLYIESEKNKYIDVSFIYNDGNLIKSNLITNSKFLITNPKNLNIISLSNANQFFKGGFIYKPKLLEYGYYDNKTVNIYDNFIINSSSESFDNYALYKFKINEYDLSSITRLRINQLPNPLQIDVCKSFIKVNNQKIDICNYQSDGIILNDLNGFPLKKFDQEVLLLVHKSNFDIDKIRNVTLSTSARYIGNLENYIRRSLNVFIDGKSMSLFPFISDVISVSQFKRRYEFNGDINSILSNSDMIFFNHNKLYNFYKLSIEHSNDLVKSIRVPYLLIFILIYIIVFINYDLLKNICFAKKLNSNLNFNRIYFKLLFYSVIFISLIIYLYK